MFENSTLYLRLAALVCAAVMSFITCPDAARASPITTQMDIGVQHTVLRRLHAPHSQQNPFSPGLPSAETETQPGTNSETEMSGNYREMSSIIDHRSNPGFTKGSFSYNQNTPDDRRTRAGVQTEVRPASRLFSSRPQHGGQSFEGGPPGVNYQPLSQDAAQKSGNSYYSYPVSVRTSAQKEAFHQRSQPPQVWALQERQQSYNEEKVPRNYSPKVAGDKTLWQHSRSSLFSPQTGRYWTTSPLISRGHYSRYKDANELAAVGPWSTSSKFLGFTSQTAPHAPSIRNSLDASVIKSKASPEKLATSITDFSQGPRSASSSEAPRHKKPQSYLFKDPQTSSGGRKTVNAVSDDGHSAFSTTPHKQRPFNTHFYGSISSNFKQLQKEEQSKAVGFSRANFNSANLLFHNTNVAQYDARTDRFPKYQHSPTAETPPQMSPGPALDLVPIPQAVFQRNHVTGTEKSVENSLGNATTGGSVHAYTPGRTTKSIFGFRGFQNPSWRAVKEPSSLSSDGLNERPSSQRYSFDKGKFKIANKHPSLTPKFSFGQRKASTKPTKLQRTPIGYSSSSPSKSETTPRPFTSGFKEAQTLLPESDMDRKPDRRQFRIHRRIYGLKGFGTRPLEGAKPLVNEPDKSSRIQQGFDGFELHSSQIRQSASSRIHRWHKKTEPANGREPIKDLSPLLKTTGSTEAVARLTPDKKNLTHLGFQPVQRRPGNAANATKRVQNPTTANRISSAYLRSALSPRSWPRPPIKPVPRAASLLNSSTSSTVRGKRVRVKQADGKTLSGSLTSDGQNADIVRLPKWPAKVKAVTYVDILGSASFSGVRATTQTPVTPPDKDFTNTTATTKQKEAASQRVVNPKDAVVSRNNTSRSLEALGEDFSSAEENKLGVRSGEVDSDMKASDLFLDKEGSGSGGFNVSDAVSSDYTSQRRIEDLLELDYLRISAGNISFKSVKLSNTEK